MGVDSTNMWRQIMVVWILDGKFPLLIPQFLGVLFSLQLKESENAIFSYPLSVDELGWILNLTFRGC